MARPLFTRQEYDTDRYYVYRAHPTAGANEYGEPLVDPVGTRVEVERTPARTGYTYGSSNPPGTPQPSRQLRAMYEVGEQLRPSHGYLPQVANAIMEQGTREVKEWENRPQTIMSSLNSLDITGQEGDLIADSEYDFRKDGPDGQMKLFGAAYRPPQNVVEMMAGTKAARVHAPTLLAMANRESLERDGVPLTASTNRSQYSEQLTSHLGAATGMPMTDRQETNDMPFSNERRPALRSRMDHYEVDPAVVQTARRNVRSILRNNRQPMDRVERPGLFDAEDYFTAEHLRKTGAGHDAVANRAFEHKLNRLG